MISRRLLLAAALVALPLHPARAQDPTPASAAEPPAASLSFAELVGRPGGLTAERVARRATATSPEGERRAADVERAQGELASARTGWLPRLGLTARYTRMSPITAPSFGPSGGSLVVTPAGPGVLGPTDPLIAVPGSSLSFPVILNQYWLQASLVVPLSDYWLRVGQSLDAASATRKAATLSRRAALLEASHRGRLAYYTWVAARLEHSVAARSVAQTAEHVRVVGLMVGAGKLPNADLLRAQSAEARAELLRAQAASRVALAEQALGTVMHEPRKADWTIGEAIFSTTGARPLDEDALLRRALEKSPELDALAEARRSVEQRRKAAAAQRLPRLDAFGNAYYANPNPRYAPPQEQWHATWDVGVQLTYSPNDAIASNPTDAKLDAELAALRADERLVRDALQQEVSRSVEGIRQARASHQAAERGVTAAEAAYQQRRALFDAGRATPAELLDAETELLRARLEVIGAAVREHLANADLKHAVGDGERP